VSGSTILRRPRQESELRVSVSRAEAGWSYLDFQAHRLATGQRASGQSLDREVALIVLGGRAAFHVGDQRFVDVGDRRDVWDRKPPYALLVAPGQSYMVEAASELHLAVAGARCEKHHGVGEEARMIGPDQVAIEERGSGQTYRYIQHVLPPSADAARLILVEVYTPGGNWSSFPPHKHDREDPPRESYLEETYYYQIRPSSGFALQRVYTADRTLDETIAPGDGDLVVVPRGFHTVAATPGHDCYYLNAMAGPTRAWNFQVDPDYAHLMNWQKPEVATSRG
jgi:5-deoxy-glucuronate isomerase